MANEDFANSIMRTAVGVLCQAIGWNSAQTSTVDILADLMKRHLMQVAKLSHRYAEHYGRSEVNFDDAALAFREMGISIPELSEYVQNFDPVAIPFPKEIPFFPKTKESHLNFLRPGSQEVLTRPVHVHEYMPPMVVVEEKEEVPTIRESDGKKEIALVNGKESNESSAEQKDEEPPKDDSMEVEEVEAPPKIKEEVIVVDEGERDLEIEVKEEIIPEQSDDIAVVKEENEKVSNSSEKEEGEIDQNSDVEEDNPGSPKPRLGFTPFSNLTPKSAKRLESPGENPALKRVRMMLEEEGHPLREITSVIMTTSGYLSSSREGRLPDTKPPVNRDFFEPAPPPPVEKRKKIPTMKKIVEGVKKIDKEKENGADKDDDVTFALFEKPDKIQTSVATPGSETVKEPKLKLKTIAPTVKVKKLKIKKEKSAKVAKLAEKLVKKASKQKEDKEKQKLKIFKKKLSQSKDEKALKRAKKLKLKAEAELKIKVSAPKKEKEKKGDDGLDAIESDEDFGGEAPARLAIAPIPSTSIIISQLKKQRKKKEKLLPKLPKKDLILKKKKLFPPPMIPIPKMSALTKEKLLFEAVKDKFSSVIPPMPPLIGAQKKKRGRPKKNVMVPPIGVGIRKEPPLKIMKIRKEHMEPNINNLIPDISINVKSTIPPKNFDLLMRLPSQPGLIPTNFVNTPSISRIPSQLPSSISITPAATSNPVTPTKESRSQQFSNLPPNVCSSVTITRIDMSNSQKLPTPFDNSNTPGIGSPNLSGHSGGSANSSTNNTPISSKGSSSSLPIPIQADSASGITITPIVMDKPDGRPPEKEFKEKPPSTLAKLEDDLKTQKKRDKEKRKELKKEKKKEKKEKLKEKDKDRKSKSEPKVEKVEKKDKKDKSEKKKKKEKEKEKDKEKEKEKEKEKSKETAPVAPAVVPKLTLKLNHSNTNTPVDSPNPPQITIGSDDAPAPTPVPSRKITFKPMEEIVKKRTPSPELARFSPLVTRPPKASRAAATKSAIASKAALTAQEVVSFPPAMPAVTSGSGGLKRGPGRPPKSGRGPGRPPKASQSGLVTETVGFYIDDQGNKIWICPACGRQDDGSPMIGCDTCDDWYHFTCMGIVDTPDETEQWFCDRCKKKQKSSSSSGFGHKKKVPKV